MASNQDAAFNQFMRELLRGGIFTVIFFRKYAHPNFIVCIFTVNQGGIKCGNRGTGFLDSEGSHR